MPEPIRHNDHQKHATNRPQLVHNYKHDIFGFLVGYLHDQTDFD